MEWVLAKKNNALLFSVVASALLIAWPLLLEPLATHATSLQNFPAIISVQNSNTPPARRVPLLTVGPATGSLIKNLKGLGLDPVAADMTSRDFFSAPGTLITLRSDNISVFEYVDATSTQADVVEFKKSANRSGRTWKQRVHLYSSGTLIVFYMGEKKDITSALASVLGPSVMR